MESLEIHMIMSLLLKTWILNHTLVLKYSWLIVSCIWCWNLDKGKGLILALQTLLKGIIDPGCKWQNIVLIA